MHNKGLADPDAPIIRPDHDIEGDPTAWAVQQRADDLGWNLIGRRFFMRAAGMVQIV
jgi:hypothetical protein